MKTLKLYGLPRTATTVAKWMIEKNLDVSVLASVAGSKHGPYCLLELGVNVDGVVLVTKNPYAWLWSIFRWAKTKKKYQCGKNFAAMLREPIVSPNPGYRDCYPNPIVWFNMMNYHWLSINREKVAVVQHESIVLKPVKTMQAVADAFGLAHRPGGFRPCPNVVRASVANGKDTGGDWASAERPEKFQRTFYVNKQYLANFTAADLKHANDWLDKDMMRRLGYSLETQR